MKVLGAEIPKHGSGSGAKGAVVKNDLANVLVEHLFPGLSEAEQSKYVKNMGAQTQQRAVDPSKLGIFSNLDPENAADKDFEKVRKVALEELQERMIDKGVAKQKGVQDEEKKKNEIAREKREKEEKERYEREQKTRKQETQQRLKDCTPKALKEFLPGGGNIDIAEIPTIEYHPVLCHFRVRYASRFVLIYYSFSSGFPPKT